MARRSRCGSAMDTTKATGFTLVTLAAALLLGHCDAGPGFSFFRGHKAAKAPVACATAQPDGVAAR